MIVRNRKKHTKRKIFASRKLETSNNPDENDNSLWFIINDSVFQLKLCESCFCLFRFIVDKGEIIKFYDINKIVFFDWFFCNHFWAESVLLIIMIWLLKINENCSPHAKVYWTNFFLHLNVVTNYENAFNINDVLPLLIRAL